MPFDGLSTMPISFFQPSIVPMICCEPRLIGAGGSLGCSARRTPAFSASGTTAFRKYVMFVHISSSVWAPSSRQRRQILHALVVEAGPAGAGAAGLFEVAFHRAVRVPVVFDDRQPDACRPP